MSAGGFSDAAVACLGQNKPAGELVDCVAEHFPDVEVYRENDDLVIKGGSRFLIVQGRLQHQHQVTHVIAERFFDRSHWLADLPALSRDFH